MRRVSGPEGEGGADPAGRASCGVVPADEVRGRGESSAARDSGWGMGTAWKSDIPDDWSRAWILRGGMESSQVIVLSRSLVLLAFLKDTHDEHFQS